MRAAVFCDASFVDGKAWAGLTCPALGLRSAAYLGKAPHSTAAEALAIRWATSWAESRSVDAIIVNDNRQAVQTLAARGVRCVWRRSTGNMANWGVIEAHITATAARTLRKTGTWAALSRAGDAAAEVAA